MAATKMTPREALALLGLDAPARGQALTAAFRKAAKAARPDQGGDEERFRRTIEAYRLLQALEAAKTGIPAAAEKTDTSPAPTPAAQARPVLEISPVEAMTGLARRVTLTNGRRLGLRLPAGLRSGETVRLAGQGAQGSDLLLETTIRPEGPMRVIGDDLWLDWEVDASVLTRGGRFTVSTPWGEQHRVTAPPALPSPPRLRLKDKGLPARGARPQGHLFLSLKARADARADPVVERLKRFRRRWAEARQGQG